MQTHLPNILTLSLYPKSPPDPPEAPPLVPPAFEKPGPRDIVRGVAPVSNGPHSGDA